MVISVLAKKWVKNPHLIIFIRDDLKLFREIIVVCIRTRIRLYVGFAKAGCFFEQNPTGILEKLSFPWRKTWQNQDNDRKNSHRSSWKIPRGETRWFWNFSWTPIRIPSVILCLPRRKTWQNQDNDRKKNISWVLEEFRLKKPDGFGILQELLWEFLQLYCVYLEEKHDRNRTMIEKILIGALEKFREEKPDGFGIFRAFLKKSAAVYSSNKLPQSWGITKTIIRAHYFFSFRFISFLLFFNSSGRNFVSAAGGCEILHEFYLDFRLDSAHKSSWFCLLFFDSRFF